MTKELTLSELLTQRCVEFANSEQAVELIKQHDSNDTLFYLDPPYVSDTRVKGNRYYNFEMTNEQHQELLNSVKEVNGRF